MLYPKLPTRETIRVWRNEDEEFSGQYAGAREAQADFIADECMEIVDSLPVDADANAINRARAQVDVRKWKAARMHPKSWGDKHQLEHSVTGGKPVTDITVPIVRPGENHAI